MYARRCAGGHAGAARHIEVDAGAPLLALVHIGLIQREQRLPAGRTHRGGEAAGVARVVAEDGVLVDVIDLEPFNTEIRCSKRPARYALEMDQGWFAERGIGRGARLEGIPEE